MFGFDDPEYFRDRAETAEKDLREARQKNDRLVAENARLRKELRETKTPARKASQGYGIVRAPSTCGRCGHAFDRQGMFGLTCGCSR